MSKFFKSQINHPTGATWAATCRLNNHNSRHGGTATGPDSRVVVLNIIAPGLRCYIREHIIMDKQSLIFSPNGTLSWIYIRWTVLILVLVNCMPWLSPHCFFKFNQMTMYGFPHLLGNVLLLLLSIFRWRSVGIFGCVWLCSIGIDLNLFQRTLPDITYVVYASINHRLFTTNHHTSEISAGIVICVAYLSGQLPAWRILSPVWTLACVAYWVMRGQLPLMQLPAWRIWFLTGQLPVWCIWILRAG